MVDLYRSATCSMEDAEYVDSLQIDNLNAHPNGEADIKFTVSLDEDNQLSAKIVDSETGNESDTTITLVSRTLEERLVTDEVNANNVDTMSKARLWLQEMKKGLDIANKMFGLNMGVKLRFKEEYDGNIGKEDKEEVIINE